METCEKCGEKIDCKNTVDGIWKEIEINVDNMRFGEMIWKNKHSLCLACGENLKKIVEKFFYPDGVCFKIKVSQ